MHEVDDVRKRREARRHGGRRRREGRRHAGSGSGVGGVQSGDVGSQEQDLVPAAVVVAASQSGADRNAICQHLQEVRSQGTVVSKDRKSTRRVLGHSLLRSVVRLHRSLIRLLRTARFARALRCAHSFARSLTLSLARSLAHSLTPELMGKRSLSVD